MKNQYTKEQFILTCLVVIFFVQSFIYAQIQNGSFVFEGHTRYYKVFLPQNFQSNMPVVFNLHGYTLSAQQQMTYTLMNNVADTAGFIVVYPDAVYPGFNSGLVGYPDLPPLPLCKKSRTYMNILQINFVILIYSILESVCYKQSMSLNGIAARCIIKSLFLLPQSLKSKNIKFCRRG
jgi:hypothetical protein